MEIYAFSFSAFALVFLWSYLLPGLRFGRLKLNLRKLERRAIELHTESREDQELREIMLYAIGIQISQPAPQIFLSHWVFMVLVSAKYPGINMSGLAARVANLRGLCGIEVNALRQDYEDLMFHYFQRESVIFLAYSCLKQVAAAVRSQAQRAPVGGRFFYGLAPA